MNGIAPGYQRMGKPQVSMRHGNDGSILLDNKTKLGTYPKRLGDWLQRWAKATPGTPFLAERRNGPSKHWHTISYRQAYDMARAIGKQLAARGLGPDKPVMVIADNSIEHAMIMLGAYLSGVPISPISTGYAESGRNFGRLQEICRTLEPGLVLFGDDDKFGSAGDTLRQAGPPLTTLSALIGELEPRTGPEREIDVGPDSTAKILFSSGSTGSPKGIINTHRMLCSNQAALAGLWPFLDAEKPIIVDWLPWSHTFGGNHNFHMILRAGGTLYIDGGRPAPGPIDVTLENLRDISPTVYFNVPRGYELLITELEIDLDLAARFFARLNTLVYAGAGLPHALYDRIDALARKILGHAVPIGTGWGSTETAPLATMTFFADAQPPNIGLPCPGTTVKLAPINGRFELRVKGPNVTPGYLGAPELTAAAFDRDGFFRTGDAGGLVDPARPEAGIYFDGRLAENFKLGTGSWVNVGALRLTALSHLAPFVQDCVVTGEHRDEIGLLLFLHQRQFDTDIYKTLAAGLSAHNKAHPAATTHIGRAMILSDSPSVDLGEITDKGYINQRAVLSARDGEVRRLYDEPDDTDIIKPEE